MNQYKVYIEDQLIDLSPSQVIGQTLQAGEIANGNLTSRIANYSNQFTVPVTNRNIAIFSQGNFLNSGSTSPYVKKACRVTVNSITVMEGVAIIKAVENNFQIQIYSMQKDINLLIGNKVLSELDFGDSPITWDAAFWDSKRASTTGWCCPVVEYGQIKKAIADGTIGDYYLPSIAVKDIVTAIFENIGYTKESSTLLANICSLNFKLAQGSPASPVISNLVMKDIDTQLKFLANKYDVRVSRYADDIVFSDKKAFNEELPRELESIFQTTPFALNKNKTYFANSDKGQRLKIHGLLVKEDKITLTKGYRNKIRAFRHMIEQGKVSDVDLPRLQGHLKFAEYIERKNQV